MDWTIGGLDTEYKLPYTKLPKGSTSERTKYGLLVIEREGYHNVLNVTLNGKQLTLISDESARSVWALRNRIVVKVDRTYMQAIVESYLWERFKDEDKQYFVPILASGHGWVIQPFIDFKHIEGFFSTPHHVVMGRLEKQYGLFDLGVRQLGLDKKGRMKIHDYGFCAAVRP